MQKVFLPAMQANRLASDIACRYVKISNQSLSSMANVFKLLSLRLAWLHWGVLGPLQCLDPTLFVDADRSHTLRRSLNRIQIAIADFNRLFFKLWIQRGEKASIESGGASDLLR